VAIGSRAVGPGGGAAAAGPTPRAAAAPATATTATRWPAAATRCAQAGGPLLAADAGAIRCRATALGRYLLYDADRRVLGLTTRARSADRVPDTAAEWVIDGARPPSRCATSRRTGR